MNNKSKTMKTILFASLIAAMILPFSVMRIADAKVQTERKDNNVSKQLDREIKRFVNSSDKFSDNSKKMKKVNDKFTEKQTELASEYRDVLDEYLSETIGENYDVMPNQAKKKIQ